MKKNIKGSLSWLIGLLFIAACFVTQAHTPLLPTFGIAIGTDVAFTVAKYAYPGIFNSVAINFPGISVADIRVENWLNDIIENLFKDNSWGNETVDESQYVLGGHVVHIPQANAPSKTVKNRNSLPAAVTLRKDSDVTYTLDEYTTDPRAITITEEDEISYDKRQSVVGEDQKSLIQTFWDNILISWASNLPTSGGAVVNMVKTSGSGITAWMPSATGSRNQFTEADLRAIKLQMDKQNIPAGDRHILITPTMMDQLITSLSGSGSSFYAAFQAAYNQIDGKLPRLHGFTIHERSTVLTTDANGNVQAYGAAGNTTDCDCALAWHKNVVSRAQGIVNMFEQAKAPNYYGDVVSFLMRGGGRVRRANAEGVFLLVAA